MFCENCGTEYKEGATVCEQCGAKLPTFPEVKNEEEVNKENDNKYAKTIKTLWSNPKVKIGGAVGVLVIVLVIVVIACASGGRSTEKTADKMLNAMFVDFDAEAFVDLIPDEVFEKEMKDSDYAMDQKEIRDKTIETIQDKLDDIQKNMEKKMGSNTRMSYEVMAEEEITGGDFEKITNKYEDCDFEIAEAKMDAVKISFKGDEDDTSESLKIYMIKVGKNWYLDIYKMGGLS